MAVKLIQEAKPKKNGKRSINLVLYYNSTRLVFYTGVETTTDYADGMVFTKKEENYQYKNTRLNLIRARADKLMLDNDLNGYTKDQLRSMVMKEVFDKKEIKEKAPKTFLYYMSEFIKLKNKKGTKLCYQTTWNRLEQYDKDCTFESMTKNWLIKFDKSMMDEGLSINYRSIHMRNIRAVFNYCIDEEVTSLYPFRRFKIKQEETVKRCLTVNQLRILRDYPVEEYQKIYRDMFMLMFYLLGINIGDLCMLKPDSLKNGRIVYHRAKTNKLYSILVPPEAKDIIKRYKGKNYLLNIMDNRKSYKDFERRMNTALGNIGPFERKGRGGRKNLVPVFPNLTTYWSRHTWATIAAYLDVPKETIGAALGHSTKTVTDIYIKLDPRKVDEANRKVIDFVNEKHLFKFCLNCDKIKTAFCCFSLPIETEKK